MGRQRDRSWRSVDVFSSEKDLRYAKKLMDQEARQKEHAEKKRKERENKLEEQKRRDKERRAVKERKAQTGKSDNHNLANPKDGVDSQRSKRPVRTNGGFTK